MPSLFRFTFYTIYEHLTWNKSDLDSPTIFDVKYFIPNINIPILHSVTQNSILLRLMSFNDLNYFCGQIHIARG